MPTGFFQSTDILDRKIPLPLVARCGECGLYRSCESPKMPPSGKGRKRILLLGEAPGKEEDRQNVQFIGESGQLLESTLAEFDVNMRKDCWIHNAVICRPPNNKLPDKAIDHCRPNAIKAVQELQPEIIILLGGSAVKSLIGWLWKEDTKGIARWIGWQIPCQCLNAWICPVWHPAFLIRSGAANQKTNDVMKLLWKRHLKKALRLRGRPWQTVPDYKSIVKVLIDDDQAAEAIHRMTKTSRLIAWDLECNGLKPDSERLEIISCSMSDGIVSISYPWQGKAIEETKAFLCSDVGKIGYNIKYEGRWVRKKLGVTVRNWRWDGMLAAHILDNRPDICGLKFQSFVLLGQESYDDHIKPFLKAKTSNEPNRIRELELRKLLLYGGLDSILEYEVAMKQAKQLRIEL